MFFFSCEIVITCAISVFNVIDIWTWYQINTFCRQISFSVKLIHFGHAIWFETPIHKLCKIGSNSTAFNPISVGGGCSFLVINPLNVNQMMWGALTFPFSNYTPEKTWMALISHTPASELTFENGNCKFLVSEIIDFSDKKNV